MPAAATDAISTGIGVQTQIYADRALNAEVWDVEGNRYIDFAAGIAVVNTGDCHPHLWLPLPISCPVHRYLPPGPAL